MSDTFSETQLRINSSPSSKWHGTGYRVAGTGREFAIEPRVRGQRFEGNVAVAVISIDQLYHAEEGSRPDLIRALSIMANGIEALELSRRAIQDGNLMLADQFLLSFQSLLPDLFGCRKIGDGFANTINAIHFAFVNRKGKPLTFDQTNLLWRIMKELRNGPFLSFDMSLEFVSQLEDASLAVYPSILADLLPDSQDD